MRVSIYAKKQRCKRERKTARKPIFPYYILPFCILILSHRNLRIYLLQEIENDGYDDEERGAADGKRLAGGEGLHDERQNSDDTKEERADESDAGDDIGEMIAGVIAGTYARDEGSAALEIFRDHLGIEGDG